MGQHARLKQARQRDGIKRGCEGLWERSHRGRLGAKIRTDLPKGKGADQQRGEPLPLGQLPRLLG